MTNVQRHNPRLQRQIEELAEKGEAAALHGLMQGLSRGEARTAGFLLSNIILPSVPKSASDFWHLFANLVPLCPKAYLGMCLLPAVARLRKGALSVVVPELEAFAGQATSIDKQKLLDKLLPELKTVDEVLFIVGHFADNDIRRCGAALVNACTSPSCYVLFKLLKQKDCPPEDLRRYAIMLMRRDEPRAFRLASIMQTYFGLSNLPGRFSFSIPPYALSLIDRSPQDFIRVLEQK